MLHFNSVLLLGISCIWSVSAAFSDGTESDSDLECKGPLGMESGKIPDDAITASSSYSSLVSADNARLRHEVKSGAWCPESVLTPDSYEYLQVDLGELHIINMVGVQGRFGYGQGQEWATHFRLEYQNAEGNWLKVKDINGEEILKGNTNTYMVVFREIVPTVTGKKLRFIPYTDKARTVCMRVEIYGCLDKQIKETSNSNVNECLAEPCLNGGTCVNEFGGFRCDCPPAISGELCEIECKGPLGMESGKIPDDAITASSSFSSLVRADNARLRHEVKGGAWCPESAITPDSYEYLQVDLGELHIINMVGVQGRFGNGQGQEWATHFRLEYQNAEGNWLKAKDINGEEILKGNTNTYTVVFREIVPNVTGKKLRFIPYADKAEAVCMRVEIYGCLDKQIKETSNSNVNECLAEPCLNGGTCVNEFGGFRCDCPSAISGELCEIDVNECVAEPCLNGGTCVNELGGFHCDCPSAISGELCEIIGCNSPLGMESGKISDDAITASSAFAEYVGAEKARLNHEGEGGAWCPKTKITNDSYEYLQIDLGEMHVISMAGIQGRFGNGQGLEYARHFRLEYQNDGDDWLRIRNRNVEEILEGNINTYIEVVRTIVPSIIAKKLRFIPYDDSEEPRSVCMRVEIYGCPAKQVPIRPNLGHASAFSVTGTLLDGPVEDSVIFKNVITNVGDDYTDVTGQFVCRIPGVYLFLISIGREKSSNEARCDLIKNADSIIQVYLAKQNIEDGISQQQGSNSVILELDKGDVVYLGDCSDVKTFTDWCTFSGSLMLEVNKTLH